MFERKDISNLKKDIVLDVNLFDCSLKLHSRWGVFSPRSIDDWNHSIDEIYQR